ncbi:serine hydrolase domain-containing protein [Plantactinospora sonchi]|uniref:Serine hydrolase domain-containing protein n=1 Tax=Plantactinospora sonchi TaxID=1544735 RepID=A0ABU7RPU6_9ACTN
MLPAAVPARGNPTPTEPPGDSSVPDRLGEVAAYLRRHMTDTRTPGFAYAIVQGDRVVGQGAWGVDGDGRRITVDTPFVLGSVTKSFTGLAVMQLVEAGRVELDQPVRRYVPWLRLADESVAARITVRQLLTHTTGLPQVAAMGLTDRYDNTPDGLARSVRDLAAVRVTAEPGGLHQYSDANYQILGVLVEEVTGQPYGEHLRRSVLDPLGMSRSAATEAEARSLGGIPAGHRYYVGHPRRFAPPFDGSGVSYGFLAASLTDVTHYVMAQLNDGRYADRSVLSAPGVAQLHTGLAGTSGTGRYAMGWRDDTLSGTGERIVWHAGATANFFGHIVLVPGSDLAVVVLGNSYSLAMDPPLTSAAFNAVQILRGGTPVTAEADPIFGWILAGLVTVGVLLLALLVWSLVRWRRLVRLVRQSAPARPTPTPASPVAPGPGLTSGPASSLTSASASTLASASASTLTSASAPTLVPASGPTSVGLSPGRTVGVTVGWLLGCAVVVAGAAWALPRSWDGARLSQVVLFAPDIGHAIVAVVGLATALALVRLGLGGYVLAVARART